MDKIAPSFSPFFMLWENYLVSVEDQIEYSFNSFNAHDPKPLEEAFNRPEANEWKIRCSSSRPLETIDGSRLQELHICRINGWLDQPS
jgi:hypothetical protein